jgi:hypothetical protein
MTEKELDEKWGANLDPSELEYEKLVEFKNDCFDMYETSGFSDAFHSPYETEKHHNGMQFKVLRRATEDECDLEAMPLWVVKFDDEEEPYYCYPEEICKLEEK